MLGVVSTAFYNAFLLIKQSLPSTIRLDTHRTFGAICKVTLWCYINIFNSIVHLFLVSLTGFEPVFLP